MGNTISQQKLTPTRLLHCLNGEGHFDEELFLQYFMHDDADEFDEVNSGMFVGCHWIIQPWIIHVLRCVVLRDWMRTINFQCKWERTLDPSPFTFRAWTCLDMHLKKQFLSIFLIENWRLDFSSIGKILTAFQSFIFPFWQQQVCELKFLSHLWWLVIFKVQCLFSIQNVAWNIFFNLTWMDGHNFVMQLQAWFGFWLFSQPRTKQPQVLSIFDSGHDNKNWQNSICMWCVGHNNLNHLQLLILFHLELCAQSWKMQSWKKKFQKLKVLQWGGEDSECDNCRNFFCWIVLGLSWMISSLEPQLFCC